MPLAAPFRAAVALLLVLRPAGAQDLRQEPIGEPLEVEDAAATDPGEVELQGTAAIERLRRQEEVSAGSGGLYRHPMEVQAQFGLAPGLEARVSAGDVFGESEDARSGGYVRLGLFGQATEFRPGLVPALGLLGRVDIPYGPGERGTTMVAIGAASWRTAGVSPLSLHLNLGWFGRPNPGPEERPNSLRVAIAVTQSIGSGTVLLAVFRREQQDRGESDLNLLLAGLRHRVAPDTTVGLVGGVGLGQDSPVWRIGLGVEHRFTVGHGPR